MRPARSRSQGRTGVCVMINTDSGEVHPASLAVSPIFFLTVSGLWFLGQKHLSLGLSSPSRGPGALPQRLGQCPTADYFSGFKTAALLLKPILAAVRSPLFGEIR